MTGKKFRPQNKNLHPNPEKLGVTLLAPGEDSVLVRVRASKHILREFQGLTPEERGRAVVAGLLALREGIDSV